MSLSALPVGGAIWYEGGDDEEGFGTNMGCDCARAYGSVGVSGASTVC